MFINNKQKGDGIVIMEEIFSNINEDFCKFCEEVDKFIEEFGED